MEDTFLKCTECKQKLFLVHEPKLLKSGKESETVEFIALKCNNCGKEFTRKAQKKQLEN